MPVIETRTEGDIFNCGADVITIPVNCVGVPGKGLAKAFAQRFPNAAAEYKKMCAPTKGWYPGSVNLVSTQDDDDRLIKNIVLFPTKDHWRRPSQLEWIEQGLESVVELFDPAGTRGRWEVNVLGVPALGCGEGGLAWADVEPLIVSKLRRLVRARRVIIFAPRS